MLYYLQNLQKNIKNILNPRSVNSLTMVWNQNVTSSESAGEPDFLNWPLCSFPHTVRPARLYLSYFTLSIVSFCFFYTVSSDMHWRQFSVRFILQRWRIPKKKKRQFPHSLQSSTLVFTREINPLLRLGCFTLPFWKQIIRGTQFLTT